MAINLFSKGNIAVKYAYDKGYRVNENGCVISPKGMIVKSMINNRGYLLFHVRVCSVNTDVFVHRLCAYQMYGELSLTADCVRHLNGNSTDNRPENIQIGTHHDNAMDISKENRIKRSQHNTKHEYHQKIIDFHNKSKSYKKTMEKFGISSRGTLHFILNKRIII